MRYLRLVVMSLLLSPLDSALAQVSIQFSLPSVRIGVHQQAYPRLVRVPGYPVYYDPRASSNYFFYDGMYWVYQGDDWYTSTWYDGPWALVERQAVPVFLLRVPVRYYRSPPAHFQGWRRDAPPRWGQHWGGDWERQNQGWDRWNRRQAPRPAPLPVYQRRYSGNRYPPVEQQQVMHGQNYRHEPRDPAVRQVYPRVQPARAPQPANWNEGNRNQDNRNQDNRNQDNRNQDNRNQGNRNQDRGGPHEPGHDSGQQRGDERGQGHDR